MSRTYPPLTPTLSRRALLGTGVSAAALIGLAACGGNEPSEADLKTLRFFSSQGDEQLELFKEQVAAFDKTASVTTTVDSLPGSGAAIFPDKLRTELLGGKGPDLWTMWGGEIGHPFATSKQAADLTEYSAQFGWDKRINANTLDGMTFDGILAGLPTSAAAVGMWYSKETFAHAKITELPKTYADLEAMNDQLVGAGITPAGMGGKFGWHIMRLFEYLLESTAGPDLHDQLLVGAESWDGPEVVEAFTRFKRWQDKGWVPDGAVGLDPADIEPSFVQGKTAYTISGNWAEEVYIKSADMPSDEFGTLLLPTDQDVVRHSGFVAGYMLNNNSKNKEKAAELLDFLAKPETQVALANGLSSIDGAQATADTSPLSAEWVTINETSPFYTIQDQAFPKKQADQYFTVQSDILQGKIDPAAAAKRMQEIISAWVKK